MPGMQGSGDRHVLSKSPGSHEVCGSKLPTANSLSLCPEEAHARDDGSQRPSRSKYFTIPPFLVISCLPPPQLCFLESGKV